jgi:type IV secretory pathway VirB10-like protein
MKLVKIAIITTLVVGSTLTCVAQSYRYMDSSGTIHFVDSVNKVPREYRQQVAPFTPTPVLDERQKRQKYLSEQAEARRVETEARRKRAEAEREKAMRDRDARAKRQRLKEQENATGFRKGGW